MLKRRVGGGEVRFAATLRGVAATLLLADLRRPHGRAAAGLLIAGGVVCFLALFPLLVAGSPSDPCVPEDASCGPEPVAFLTVGLTFFGLGLLTALVGAWFAWRRTRLIFVAPPGWPRSPAGWVPPRGWEPDPRWPAAPDGWVFWRPSR
jgi:hypothetical protein